MIVATTTNGITQNNGDIKHPHIRYRADTEMCPAEHPTNHCRDARRKATNNSQRIVFPAISPSFPTVKVSRHLRLTVP